MNSIVHPVSNTDFLAELAQAAPEDACLWVNKFDGNPNGDDAKWGGFVYTPADHQRGLADNWAGQNTYFSVAALNPTPDDNIVRRRKRNFARMLAIVVDDVELDSLYAEPSWVIETSPGKTQAGYFLDEDDTDCADEGLCSAVVKSMTMKGFIGGDISGNNAVRYVRLPVGTNQKPRSTGFFQHRLTHWNPSVRLTLEDACGAVGMDLDAVRNAATLTGSNLPTLTTITGSQDEKIMAATKAVMQGNFHEPLNIIAASMISSGAHPAAVINMLRGLMEAYPGAHDDRWEMRYKDIPRCVRGAEEKFGSRKSVGNKEPNIQSLKQLLASDLEFHYVWQHILVDGWLYALTANPGSGKTAVSLYLCVMLALGRELLGRKTRPCRVLYLCGENPSDVRLRTEVMLMEMGVNLKALEDRIHFTRRPFAIDSEEQLAQFVHEAQEFGPFDLMFIDTGPAHSEADDENDNRAMHDLAMALRNLMAPLGMPCTIALMHPIKGATRDNLLPRGGSAFTGSIDGCLCLHRHDFNAPVELFAHSQKFRGQHFKPMWFELEPCVHPTARDNFGDQVQTVVARPAVGFGSTTEHDPKRTIEVLKPELREQLLKFIAAIEADGSWIGKGVSGTNSNNPFRKGWLAHPVYPPVLFKATLDMRRFTFVVIDEMIDEGVLIQEKRSTKEGQRERDWANGLWVTDKGKAVLSALSELQG